MTINSEGNLTGIKAAGNSYRTWVKRHDPCVYCFKTPDAGAVFTFDHIVPVSKGGLDAWSNKAVACYECNRRKSSRGLLTVLVEARHQKEQRFVRGCVCRVCQGRREKEFRRQDRVVRRLWSEDQTT